MCFNSDKERRALKIMNLVKILTALCVLKLSYSGSPPRHMLDGYSISTAIANICEEFFIKNSIKFDLIIYGERTYHFDDILDGILEHVGGNFSKTVRHIDDLFNWDHELEDSAVILFYQF